MRALTAVLTLLVFSAGLPAAGEVIELFNGRDLEGWTCDLDQPGAALEDVWEVKDGILVCRGRPVGCLITERADFSDYTLTVEWRWPGQGGNSGVLVHASTPRALGIWPKCLEVQLGSGDAGDFWVIGSEITVPDQAKRQQGRRHLNLTDGSEKELGEWNTMEISCHGDRVTVKVNGDLVNECTGSSETQGAIALQSEGTPIEFRKVTLVRGE